MNGFRSALKLLVVLAVVVGSGWFVIRNWSFIFSENIKGEVLDVKRITDPTAIIGGRVTGAQIHSYAVLIKTPDGKLYAASSEDRKWEVAVPGYCVEAQLYKYPPWEFSKSDTYFNARLIELSACPGKPLPPIAPGTLPGNTPGQPESQQLQPQAQPPVPAQPAAPQAPPAAVPAPGTGG